MIFAFGRVLRELIEMFFVIFVSCFPNNQRYLLVVFEFMTSFWKLKSVIVKVTQGFSYFFGI